MKRKLKRLHQGYNGFQFILDQSVREELSPIVFFDAGISKQKGNGIKIGMHPHSGIGIITYYEGADLVHDDTGDNQNILLDGGVQWIQAGSGIWHTEAYQKKASELNDTWSLTIHQLWVQLPSELEEGEPVYQNLQPADVPIFDNVKVIAGSYKGIRSPLQTAHEMTYLDVNLSQGESFKLETPNDQTRGFVFLRQGNVSLYDDPIKIGHIGILEESGGEILIQAEEDSKFILVLAEPQNESIVARSGSIHTNAGSLERSFGRIEEIGTKRNLI